MLRSLYSAISGMGAHQTKLNVIGNNIANVNTYGFKSSRVVFSDVMYQTLSSSTAGDAAVSGGVSSSQLGYGVSVASVDRVNTNASGADTGNSMDCFIDGDGYFIVQTGLDANDEPIFGYTRVGAFSFDSSGNLVDDNGSIVYGSCTDDPTTDADPIEDDATLDDLIPINFDFTSDDWSGVTGISIGEDGAITGIVDNETVVMGYIALGTFANPSGLDADGDGYYVMSNNSGSVQVTAAGENGSGDIQSGALEMSNVDLSREFTEMITAQRGFQANSRIVTVSDTILEELVNLKR